MTLISFRHIWKSLWSILHGASIVQQSRTAPVQNSPEEESGKTENNHYSGRLPYIPDAPEMSRPPPYIPDAPEMRKVFDQFDQNHDGLICENDLSLFMRSLGFQLPVEEVRSMLQTIDFNNDNSIDFEEFFSLYRNVYGEGTSADAETGDDKEAALIGAFSVFDKNNDGYISPSELQQVLLNLGMREGRSLMNCKRMIEKVDIDGNGQVDFDEFKVLMCSAAFQL